MKQINILLVVACLSFCLLIYGFVIGVAGVLNPQGAMIEAKSGQEEQQEIDGFHLTALGDSLTRGVGDREGKGYVRRLHDMLQKESGQGISLSNLGVSGATIGDLQASLEQEGVRHAIAQANIIVLTIGGNDLFPGADVMGTIDFSSYETDVDTFRDQSKKLLNTLRKINKEAPIYWLSLYNPFENIEGLEDTSQYVLEWNYALKKLSLAYEQVYIIPTFDLFQGEVDTYISSDHFHPNEYGYELMAQRLFQKINSQWNLGSE